jgi:membrane protein DedA with SNARE-associated domain
VLTDLTQWVTDVVESLGYVGVALLVAIENVFPPIPSEVVLGLAGFVAARGDASAYGMVAAATVGSLVGAWVLYGISAGIGPVRMRALVVRYGGWIRMTEADLDRAEGWFDSKARLAVLICRCIPLIRSLISIPAGFRRMPIGQFTLYTLIGSLVWNTALVGAGYALGDRWEKIVEYMEQFQNLVILAILLAVGWYVWTKFVAPKRKKAHHHTPVE